VDSGEPRRDDDPGTVDWPARARAVAPVVAAAADRIEAERHVPDDVMAALHEAKLFRMCLPGWLGGGEASPLAAMLACESIAAADASAAWCLGQALGCSRSAAFLEPEVAREVFGRPEAILAWGPPKGAVKAVAIEGGYRVSGEWRLASGIRNANWLGPLCAVVESDGDPQLDSAGRPVMRTMLLPISSARLTDVWRVIGLKGTGSDEFAIDDLFVPEAFSFVRDSAAERREDGPLYRMALTTFYGIVFAGVALGVARTMLDDFIGLAATKKPSHNATVLRENPAVQRDFARAEASLGSARSYLIDMIGAAWHSGAPPDAWPLDVRARLRIAATNAVEQARDVVEYAYRAAGSTAIFTGDAFERRLRDINTVAQQAQGQPVNMEHSGMALLGLEQEGGRV
jgi:alkylation response protein AidB-like acyl-CoA dehydrogenase